MLFAKLHIASSCNAEYSIINGLDIKISIIESSTDFVREFLKMSIKFKLVDQT